MVLWGNRIAKNHEPLEPAGIQRTLRGVWLVYSCNGT